MKAEALNIEAIKSRISEYQKKIELNYSVLHNEELEDYETSKIIEETNQIREMVYTLQNRLKDMYKEMFSGTKKATSQVV